MLSLNDRIFYLPNPKLPMLRLVLRLPARSQNHFQCAAFNSCAPNNSLRPPLNLDPSLQTLLKDVDISLKHAKVESTPPIAMRELEVLDDVLAAQHEVSMDDWSPLDPFEIKVELEQSEERKSPAALFGSQRIGMVVLPLELQSAISHLIAGTHLGRKWRLSLITLVLNRRK